MSQRGGGEGVREMTLNVSREEGLKSVLFEWFCE